MNNTEIEEKIRKLKTARSNEFQKGKKNRDDKLIKKAHKHINDLREQLNYE